MPFFSRREGARALAEDPAVQRSLKLGRIFEDTGDLAWRTLRRLGVPSRWVEDSFQKVFLIASERIDDILPGRERSFIYGVSLRVARGYSRIQGRDIGGYDVDGEVAIQIDAETLVDRLRLVELCDRILSRLTPELREVFTLHECEGLRGLEIAELLGIPEGTVNSRLRRARIRVRWEVEALATAETNARLGPRDREGTDPLRGVSMEPRSK